MNFGPMFKRHATRATSKCQERTRTRGWKKHGVVVDRTKRSMEKNHRAASTSGKCQQQPKQSTRFPPMSTVVSHLSAGRLSDN